MNIRSLLMLLLLANSYNSLQKQYFKRILSLRMSSGLTELVFDNRNARYSLTHSLTYLLTHSFVHLLTQLQGIAY